MNTTSQQYQNFQQNRYQLLKLVSRHIKVLCSLNMTQQTQTLEFLEERIKNDNFKVLVVGEFKRGKSTLINALLKQEVLPAYSTPCTAIINEVKWSNKRKAVLHFKPSKSGSHRPPQEIDVNELEEYVVIQDPESKEQEIQETPYEKAELFWDLELCRDGVEIIDSPGLNEHEVRQKTTLEYVYKTDAVLFVLSCAQLGPSTSERQTIELLKNCGHEDIIFVCNRFLEIRSDKEKERVKKHGIKVFSSLTNLGEKGIFFMDAADALDGYVHNKPELVKNSGIEALEQFLAIFLTDEKGKIKIIRSEKVFRKLIEEAKIIIPEREEMLKTDLAELEKRYFDSQKSLQSLENDLNSIVKRISGFREDTKDLVRQKVREFLDKIANKIESWVKTYEIKEGIKLLSGDIFKLENATKRVVTEVTTYLSRQVENEFSVWQNQVLQPFLANRLEELMSELDNRAGKFFSELSQIRLQLTSGSNSSNINIQLEEAKVSPINRILSGIAGLVLMDFASSAMGGLFGYKEMLKSIIPQIATIAVTTAIAGFQPWVLIPAILGTGSIQALLKVNSINDKIKQGIGKEYINQIRASKQPDDIAGEVGTKIKQIEDAINQEMAKEIQSVRTQVESILAEKKKGQENVDQKIQELRSLSKELNAIDSELNDLMRSFIQLFK